MNTLDTPNPNHFDKAIAYLENFKDTHKINPDAEESLLGVLADYFSMKPDGNPSAATVYWWNYVEPMLRNCELKETTQV